MGRGSVGLNHRRLTVSGAVNEAGAASFSCFFFIDWGSIEIYTPEQADTAS